jgi:polyisoprenoid-binding protein YceI
VTASNNQPHSGKVPMNSRLASTVFLVGLTLLPLRATRAQEPVAGGRIESGTLSFDGRATVGDFTGTTTSVTGEMTGGLGLADVRGWVEAAVDSLKTGNKRRDTDLAKSMETAEYPTMRYDLDGVTPQTVGGDTVAVTLHGRFSIHGVVRNADIPARVILAGDHIRLLADTPLNLKDYKIGHLTKMLGMLTMHEDIVVHVDVTFATGQPGENPGAAVSSAGRTRN